MGVGEGWDGKYKWVVGSCVYTERITKFGLVGLGLLLQEVSFYCLKLFTAST